MLRGREFTVIANQLGRLLLCPGTTTHVMAQEENWSRPPEGGGPQPSTTLQCALGLIPGGQTHISLNQPNSTIPNHLHHHLARLHSTLHQTFPHSLTQYSTASIFTILRYSAAELHRELTSIKVLVSALSGHHGHVRGHAGRHLWVRGHAVLHGGA